MTNNYLKPDCVFEISWEVCNKMGGIHTVLATKAQTLMKELNDNLIFIGPDIWRGPNVNPEFIEDKNLFPAWQELLKKEGHNVKIGRWNIVGKPIVFLIDFSPFVALKNDILANFWEKFHVDSLTGQWDYIESVLFGHAAAKIIQSYTVFNLNSKSKVVAQFHEWMTGSGVLTLKAESPQIATIFTTHATTVGRSLSGNGYSFYDNITEFDGDKMAHQIGVVAKHSVEKNSAIHSDCFTTVSEITALECEQFLNRKIDVVTPNGFEEDFVPTGAEFDEKRKYARKKLKEVAEALLGYDLSDNVLFISNSGRYEYKNKGIDLFLDSLKRLNDQTTGIKRETVAFILVPANSGGPRKDLIEKLESKNKSIILENPFLTHKLNDIGYDPVINKVQEIHLTNSTEDKIKLIFVPCYLNGNDGIFNMPYYDVLIGMDLTVFPSSYEPWGYTPVESLAFYIPTITTTLAGFGIYAKELSSGIKGGVEVVTRNDHNYDETADKIANLIKSFSISTDAEVLAMRNNAKAIAATVEWDHLIKHYYHAYDVALNEVTKRSDKIVQVQSMSRIKIEPTKSNLPVWKKIVVKSKLPDNIKPLYELSRNLWWCWNYRATELFEFIDSELWESTNKNPILLLEKVSFDRLNVLANSADYVNKLNGIYDEFRQYMDAPYSTEQSIAYFSMEYGLDTNLKIYSGGLGILAGDYLKEVSDCRVNLTAVGLLYKYGYFRQTLTLYGDQMANYEAQEFASLPIEKAKNDNGEPLVIELDLPGRNIYANVWVVKVGRVSLYLLDTDHPLNNVQDREITHKLYGGDWENRLKQEMLLGLGGIRMLNALGINSDLYHCNEGHAALINVQRLTNLVESKFKFNEALEIVRSSSLFTTHTPVPAGHDSFDEDMFRVYMRHFPDRLKISWDDFMNMGREHANNADEKFSMSVLALKTSQEVNGVSWLHGEVSKDMFKDLWKGYFPEEVPIGFVTNGVHFGTWAADEWQKLYEREFDPAYKADLSNKTYWAKIHQVSDDAIWNTRKSLRKKLLDYIKNRIEKSMNNSHEDPSQIIEVMDKINENALTIGFARRFATYKRAHLLFTDIDRLSRIVNNPKRPVQFIFAGKAHPADGAGQGLIRRIVEISKRPEFIGKVIFLENYDIELGKRLVSGVDIWMNTPTRPLEASGTSGQKAELNGVLNFSVLDGWWYEGYKDGGGWALTDKQTYERQEFQDELDAATIYSMFENEIIPLYYDQNDQGISTNWVQYIKKSIAIIAPEFTTKRMLDDYLERFYNKMYNRLKGVRANDYQKACEIAEWKKRVVAGWNQIEVLDIDMPDIWKYELGIGDDYEIKVTLDLKNLIGITVGVEVVFTDGTDDHSSKILAINEFSIMRIEGSKVHYRLQNKLKQPGVFNFGIRMYPKNDDLPYKQDTGLVRWL